MNTIEFLYKTWAGLLLALVHTGILVYWAQPGDYDGMWVNITLIIFMFLPIATIIVLINRGGMSMALGLIYALSFSVFVVGLAYFDRVLITSIYLGVLASLMCNDVIRHFMEVEQRHFSAP